MMPCGQDREKLAAYLDGEIGAEQERELQQHIRTCTECAAEIATIVNLRRAMKPAASRFKPNPEFRRKIQAQVAPSGRKFGAMRFFPAVIVALAVFLIAVVGTRQQVIRADSFREVADLHISDLASANPYDIVSSDRHTVKPWFQGRIPFAFNLPEFGGTEFNLLGGRMVYLHQQPAAQVIVGMRQHKISVLIVQDAALPGSFPFSGGVDTRDSFNMETWKTNGLRFFVIGDVEKPEIQRLSQSLRSANE